MLLDAEPGRHAPLHPAEARARPVPDAAARRRLRADRAVRAAAAPAHRRPPGAADRSRHRARSTCSARVFRPSEGFVLALLGITIVIAVFLVTALFGRVWCGWGCPQTVYLELVFRPIERWLEGSRGRARRVAAVLASGRCSRHSSFALSNVFLAYFVGTERLEHGCSSRRCEHPVGFWHRRRRRRADAVRLRLVSRADVHDRVPVWPAAVGAARQAVADRRLRRARGEPRDEAEEEAAGGRAATASTAARASRVCPTGIDIRDGLQMECIGCAQCIDACDDVMDKLGRKRGLIRYTSQDELAGKPRRLLADAHDRLSGCCSRSPAACSRGGRARARAPRSGSSASRARASSSCPTARSRRRRASSSRTRATRSGAITCLLVESPGAIAALADRLWPSSSRTSRSRIPMFIDVPRDTFVGGKRARLSAHPR